MIEGRRTAWVFAVALALATTACESGAGNSGGGGSGPGSGGYGGGDSDSSASGRSRSSGTPEYGTFSAETRKFMEDGLHQFSRDDPAWPETRAKWLAMGKQESDFLVKTVWAGLLKSQALGEPELVEKARHELAQIGEPAVPLMAQFLAGGTVYTDVDPKTGERTDVKVDEMAQSEAGEVLGLIGAPAVPAVRDVLERADTKSGRRHAIETLGYIGERGGAAAMEPLLQWAKSDDDVMRVHAVRALRYFHDETTRSALIGALSDSEDLVRKKAVESLMVRRETSAAAYIRGAAQRVRDAGKLAEADEMERCAAALEKSRK